MNAGLLVMLCGCVLLVDAPVSAEDAPNCKEPVTQSDMNECAGLDFEKADAELNAQWKLTRKALADWDKQLDANWRGGEKSLLKAQRAWIDYRDGECEAQGFSARGGTMEPMLVASCKAELTQKRTEELKALAKLINGEG